MILIQTFLIANVLHLKMSVCLRCMNNIILVLPQRKTTGSRRTEKEKELCHQNGKEIKPNRYEVQDTHTEPLKEVLI